MTGWEGAPAMTGWEGGAGQDDNGESPHVSLNRHARA